MTLVEFVLACMLVLSPARYHAPLAIAIARAVDAEPALFRDDADKRRTAALLVAVAFRESSLKSDAAGDCPGLTAGSTRCTLDKATAFGAFQTALPRGAKTAEGLTGRELVIDSDAQARTALVMLRQSFAASRACGSELGLYAMGPACSSNRAKRISLDRIALARNVFAKVIAIVSPPESP